ncbi:aspartate aminotransferase family protein [Leucobacter sp. W1038]|uniref:aminotransferase family protein n=1 Tax=Leucobacter sp. W1038 TaxID=3438281 RepID=UPI003D97E02F
MPTVIENSVTIVRGDGVYLFDSQGKRYLDGTAALFLANVGHTQPKLIEAAHRQMKKLEFYHNHGNFVGEPAERLASRIRDLGPIHDSKVFFTSGGSDSVDTACKLARLHWQSEGLTSKKYILYRDRAYHGLHGFGTSVAGIHVNREGLGVDSLVPETLQIPWNDIAEVGRLILELGPENIAAVITEPVIGSGGVLGPPAGYFEGLNSLARKHQFLIIVDEVITGFGRTGDYWGSERYGIEADMIVMAKGMTSGYFPLGGVQVHPRVWNRYFADENSPVFRHGLTYAGHNTGCAVAEANLDLIEELELVENVRKMGAVLDDSLRSLLGLPGVVETRTGHGLLAGIQFESDVDLTSVVVSARENGVLIRELSNKVIALSPPFTIESRHVDEMVEAIRYGVSRL